MLRHSWAAAHQRVMLRRPWFACLLLAGRVSEGSSRPAPGAAERHRNWYASSWAGSECSL